MDRNYLKGREGDSINAVLAAALQTRALAGGPFARLVLGPLGLVLHASNGLKIIAPLILHGRRNSPAITRLPCPQCHFIGPRNPRTSSSCFVAVCENVRVAVLGLGGVLAQVPYELHHRSLFDHPAGELQRLFFCLPRHKRPF
jgi:hypothetical protein